jgi:hypothetical protein
LRVEALHRKAWRGQCLAGSEDEDQRHQQRAHGEAANALALLAQRRDVQARFVHGLSGTR